MVVLEIEENHAEPVQEDTTLREERKRTGRYVAAGAAIFLSLLGVYQALIQGTPEYAALFAPAVIMFIYVAWILHASKHQNARLMRLRARVRAERIADPLISVDLLPEKGEDGGRDGPEDARTPPVLKKDNVVNKHCNRSYSIA